MQLKQSSVLNFISILFVSIFILYCSRINILFTDSFYTVELREIDDIAFLNVIFKRLDTLKLLNFSDFIGITEYGYGVIFWILSFFSAIPGFILNSTELIIFGPRFFSTLCFVVGSLLLVKAIKRNIPREFEYLSLIGLLGLTMPMIFFMSLRFQNKGLVFFLISLSLHFLFNNEMDFYKRVRFSLITQSIAIGTSLYALGSLPFLLVIIFDLYRKEKRINKINFLVFSDFWIGNLIISFACYLIAYQPKFLFFPFYLEDCINSIKLTFSVLPKTANTINDNYLYFENLKSALNWHFNLIFIVTITFISLILMFFRNRINTFLNEKQNNFDKFFFGNNTSIYYGFLYFLIYTTFLCFKLKDPHIVIASYFIPAVPIMLMSLADITLNTIYFFQKLNKIFFLTSFLLVIFLAFPINSLKISEVANKYSSELILSRLKKFKTYEKCLQEIFQKKINNNKGVISVITPFTVPVPCGNIDKTCNKYVVFNELPPKISNINQPDIIIFDKFDSLQKYIDLNKEYIKNIRESGKSKLNYIKETCNELNILIKDN